MTNSVLRALRGTWALARGDADALVWFDFSADGFWSSFLAVPLSLPLTWAVIALHGSETPLFTMIAVCLSWVGFLIVLAPVLRLLGLVQGYAPFVVCYNWAQLPLTIIQLPVAALIGLDAVSSGVISSVELALFLVSLLYLGRIARRSLGASLEQAVAVVLLETVSTWWLQDLLRSLQNWLSQ